jgi:hypothetical protein
MEIPIYENRRNAGEYSISESGNSNEALFEDDYFEVICLASIINLINLFMIFLSFRVTLWFTAFGLNRL